MTPNVKSFEGFPHIGLAIDPIHVGTGGSRLGRVDNTIIRDPVTRIPKIPGSSLAGVMRAYCAMKEGKYPQCAGLKGHCGTAECRVCTTFGFARGNGGGFAGLAAFSDAHVLLFPVATREGPFWITCPMALNNVGITQPTVEENVIFRSGASRGPLNLGWILLPVQEFPREQNPIAALRSSSVPEYIVGRCGTVSDKVFAHVVNSNLEVRTSVAIDPETGAAEDQALFSYEAIPRGTILRWEITCRNPRHFKVEGASVNSAQCTTDVHKVVVSAHSYLEYLGVGGMGTRGMGRLRVLAQDTLQKNG